LKKLIIASRGIHGHKCTQRYTHTEKDWTSTPRQRLLLCQSRDFVNRTVTITSPALLAIVPSRVSEGELLLLLMQTIPGWIFSCHVTNSTKALSVQLTIEDAEC